MVIPLRVQCSKDFVCNRRQHSSRSQRASLSLGIRFEADNVIVLRGESPQSSLGRACRLQLIFIWCLGNEGQGVVKVRQHTNMHTNNIMARMESSSSQKVWLQLYGCPPPLLSAAFPARRAMKRASRQILTALPPSASLSLSLPPRTGAKPMGAVSARVVGGWYRVGALPTVGDPTSHFGRLAGTMWPVSEGERGEATKEKVIKKDGIYSHHLHRSRG
jgi:hypothetical protein